MVKLLILTVCMVLVKSQFLPAQDSLVYGIFPVNAGRIIYEKNVSIENTSKDKIFKRAVDWYNSKYGSQKHTDQVEDKDQGSLNYNGFVTVSFAVPARKLAADWICWHTIKILCQDNKAKIIIADLEQRAPSGYGTITSVKIEEIKAKTDSLPGSVFFGKKNKERYRKAELVTLRELDKKIKALIASFVNTLRVNQPD